MRGVAKIALGNPCFKPLNKLLGASEKYSYIPGIFFSRIVSLKSGEFNESTTDNQLWLPASTMREEYLPEFEFKIENAAVIVEWT